MRKYPWVEIQTFRSEGERESRGERGKEGEGGKEREER